MTSQANLDDQRRRTRRKEFSELLRASRESAHLSRNDVAAKLKVSNQVVKNWELMRGVPDGELARELEQLLAPDAAGLARLAEQARHPRPPAPPTRSAPTSRLGRRQLLGLVAAVAAGVAIGSALTLVVAGDLGNGKSAPPASANTATSSALDPLVLEDWVKVQHAAPHKVISEYDGKDSIYSLVAGLMRGYVQRLLPEVDRTLAELTARSATRAETARRLRPLRALAAKTFKAYADYPFIWLAEQRRDTHVRLIGHLANLVQLLEEASVDKRQQPAEKLDTFALLGQSVERLHAAIEDLDLHGPASEGGYMLIKGCPSDTNLTMGARLNGAPFQQDRHHAGGKQQCPIGR